MTELEKLKAFEKGLLDNPAGIRTDLGVIFPRTTGRTKGKCRALRNDTLKHIKGVFDSPSDAYAALRADRDKREQPND